MAIIKYTVKENNTLGTHSFYAQAVTYSTLTVTDLAPEIVEGMGLTTHVVEAIINRYADVVVREVQRGHRVKFGDVAFFYPQISVSVKDVVDENNNVITKATADMLSAQNAKSSIGCTVTQNVQQEFAKNVNWKRITDDDDTKTTTDGGDGTGGNGSGTTTDTGTTTGTGTGDSASSSGSTSGDSDSSKGGNE